MDWRLIEKHGPPSNQPLLVTNGHVWTLARLIAVPVKEPDFWDFLSFCFPKRLKISQPTEWAWVYSASTRCTRIDFKPTYWKYPDVYPSPLFFEHMKDSPCSGDSSLQS